MMLRGSLFGPEAIFALHNQLPVTLFTNKHLRAHPAALGGNNGVHLPHGIAHGIVKDQIVVMRSLPDFVSRVEEAFRYFGFAFGDALPEPALQLLMRGW